MPRGFLQVAFRRRKATQKIPRSRAGPSIGQKDFLNRFRWAHVSFTNNFRNCSRYVVETNLSRQKRRHRDLVGRVQGNSFAAALLSCFVSQTQARELIKIGSTEIKPPQLTQVEAQVGGNAIWPGKRI